MTISYLPKPHEPLHAAALALWRHRMASYPAHTRREPDSTDYATGAWARVVSEAQAVIDAYVAAKAAEATDEDLKWR